MTERIIAVERLLDSVWTMVFETTNEPHILKLLTLSCNIAIGYRRENKYPKGQLVDVSVCRIVVGAIIDGKEYYIANQKHIFDYDSSATAIPDMKEI